MQISSALTRRWSLLALVALLGLAVTVANTSASGASSGHATAAKKHKCKKKGKKSATSAKKKHKCKKKKVQHVVLPAPAPLVRGTLAWSADDEVDLHAIDANGNHAGWDNNANSGNGGVVNNIPNAHHNGDVGPGGPQESFTDDIFVLGGSSNREFSFVACLYNDPDPAPYTATFTGVTSNGTSSTLTLDGPDVIALTVPGGPPVSDSQALSTCNVTI